MSGEEGENSRAYRVDRKNESPPSWQPSPAALVIQSQAPNIPISHAQHCSTKTHYLETMPPCCLVCRVNELDK